MKSNRLEKKLGGQKNEHLLHPNKRIGTFSISLIQKSENFTREETKFRKKMENEEMYAILI